MKRFISLTITLLMILILISCTSKNDIKKLNYEGISDNWKVSIEFNTSGDSKIFIRYIGNSTIPKKINFDFEHLSKNISSGDCEYSKTLDGFNIVFPNDDKLNDNIEKYNDKKTLNITIKWDQQNEKIELQRVK